jgi:hypothetical protein
MLKFAANSFNRGDFSDSQVSELSSVSYAFSGIFHTLAYPYFLLA